jgi:pilus assembly protein CpaB
VKNKALTMIGIAVLFGGLSIFAADIWLKSQAEARVETAVPIPDRTETAAIKFGTIVVADESLAFGRPLAEAKLREIPWPVESMPEGAFASLGDLSAAGGRVVLTSIQPNEPILLGKLSGPGGRATLSNLLSPGMRAVTIRVDEIAGVGGFVAPGDRVDVVMTRDAGAIEEVSSNARGAAGSTIATEIVVENVRVLSVGQAADERQTAPTVASSVTLEVTVDGAQKVALARSIGSLSLSLRAGADAAVAGGALTTISAFGGSAFSNASSKGAVIMDALSAEPEGPGVRTVIVTRGIEPQAYEVVVPRN